MARQPCVYILTNETKTVLYTGVTSDLARRIAQHREGRGSAFTSRYQVTRLVYFEEHGRMYDAIDREKQIKAGSRADKIRLIESMNPEWRDLFDDLHGWV